MAHSLYCVLVAMTLSQVKPSPTAPVLGVEVVSMADGSKQHPELKLKSGAFVKSIVANGSFDVAGVRNLDVITKIDEIDIQNTADFAKVTSRLKAGEKHELSGWKCTLVKGAYVWDRRANWTLFVQSAKESLANEFLKTIDREVGLTTFRHSDASRAENTQSELQLFVSRKGTSKPRLNLRIQQVKPANASKLAVKEIVIQADDKTFTITPSEHQVKHGSGNGKAWEAYTTEVDASAQKIIDALAKSKRIVIETKGDDYSNVREMSSDEIGRIAKTLQFFDWWDK